MYHIILYDTKELARFYMLFSNYFAEIMKNPGKFFFKFLIMIEKIKDPNRRLLETIRF